MPPSPDANRRPKHRRGMAISNASMIGAEMALHPKGRVAMVKRRLGIQGFVLWAVAEQAGAFRSSEGCNALGQGEFGRYGPLRADYDNQFSLMTTGCQCLFDSRLSFVLIWNASRRPRGSDDPSEGKAAG